jgi:hypothetical protein
MSATNSQDKSQGSTWLGSVQQLCSDTAKGLKKASQSSVEVGTDALSWSTDVALTVGQKGVDTAIASKDGWEKVGAFSTDTWDRVSEISGTALKEIQQVPNRLSSLIFQDCPVPLFLLPVGGKPDEFICIFDFEEVATKLQSGILVRPRIEVWAGRDDLNRGHLGIVLRDEFTRQLHEKRAKAASNAYRKATATAERMGQSQEQSNVALQSSAQVALSAALFMLMATNPIVDVLFLCLAIFGASSTILEVFKQMLFSSQLQNVEGDLENDLQQLEADCDVKNRGFQEAIKDFHVRIHPLLREVAEEFSEVTCESFSAPLRQEEPLAGPDISRLLNDPQYRHQLPTYLHPIINEISRCLGSHSPQDKGHTVRRAELGCQSHLGWSKL